MAQKTLIARLRARGDREWGKASRGARLTSLLGVLLLGGGALTGVLLVSDGAAVARPGPLLPGRSTTIALTKNNRFLIVANRDAHTVSILEVRKPGLAPGKQIRDAAEKLAEVGVGHEPRCVAVAPDGRKAFVVNALSGTVSLIQL